MEHVPETDVQLPGDDDVAQVEDCETGEEDVPVLLRKGGDDGLFLVPQLLQLVLRPAPELVKVAPEGSPK